MGENANDKNKKTALHLAASLGKKKAVEELLKKGASADAEDKDNRTLHLAVMGDGKEVGGLWSRYWPR